MSNSNWHETALLPSPHFEPIWGDDIQTTAVMACRWAREHHTDTAIDVNSIILRVFPHDTAGDIIGLYYRTLADRSRP